MGKAKEAWIMKTATFAETAVKNGPMRWDCIRELQMVHSGRRSIRNSTLERLLSGQLGTGPVHVSQNCPYLRINTFYKQ